ncbi:hypothetical protein ACT6QG_09985 [Xanthobacter sp. TB0136]|uniref:hypothetical protein n=1 Tax=Xanthobacter sp. TB0136 TaxID=3459177 RepID=UPI004039D3C0
MTREIFIHIGTHKTGTTSIQALLWRRATRLRKAGIHVPHTGRPFPNMAGHHNIGWLLRGDSRADPALGGLDELVRELADAPCPKAVISAEDLQFLAAEPRLLRLMEQTFEAHGWQPHYIVFLRDPSSYAISLFHEMRKTQPDLAFSDFSESILRNGYFHRHATDHRYFDYEAFLARWTATARGPVDLYSYDAASAGVGVVETFLSALGITQVQRIMREAITPRQIRDQIMARINMAKAPASGPAILLNQNTRPVSEEMRQQAAKIGEAFQPGYERLMRQCRNR